MTTLVPLVLPTLGVPELLIILVIVLLLFGAGRVAQVGEALGKGIKNFRKAMSEPDEQPRELQDLSSIEADEVHEAREASSVRRDDDKA